MAGRKSKMDLYGTKDVAAILGLPMWRIKNFSEGESYGLPPSVRIGSGRGSRRLYTFEDVIRIGIARELVDFGFAPEVVGNCFEQFSNAELSESRLREMTERLGMTELLSIEDAAKALALSPWTLRAHLKRGAIKPVRFGRRVLISRAEIERLAAEGLPSLRGASSTQKG